MIDDLSLKVIAHIKTDFKAKFGIPRQSGLVKSTKGRIIFCDEYKNREALRGIEGYSHLWLLWKFSESIKEDWSPTVRPPRLGGNKRMGVFATRSPFRPNPIGLSSVKLERIIENTPDGTILEVSGADLLDGTPIYDIKPYLPYADSKPDAKGSYAEEHRDHALEVVFPEDLLQKLPEDKRQAAIDCLKDDPRPSYHDDERVYSMLFADCDIRFTVKDGMLTVCEIEK